MNSIATFLVAFLLTTPSLSLSLLTRPEASGSSPPQLQPSNNKGHHATQNNNKGGGGGDGGMDGFFGPGRGLDIPGLGTGWGNGIVGGGYGSGFGGPSGGYSKHGTMRTSVVCKEKGPCYKKKLICPAKCYTSYSRSGKNYGGGGGGGGCTIDCKKCVAYC